MPTKVKAVCFVQIESDAMTGVSVKVNKEVNIINIKKLK